MELFFNVLGTNRGGKKLASMLTRGFLQLLRKTGSYKDTIWFLWHLLCV